MNDFEIRYEKEEQKSVLKCEIDFHSTKTKQTFGWEMKRNTRVLTRLAYNTTESFVI